MIANIASDDALTLPHRANPAGLNFRERQVMRLAIMRNSMGAGRQKAYNCASKQSERVRKAKAKLDKLGIKIESIHYTQSYYDFVDIVDAPNPEAMLAFSVWYSTQRLGGSKVCRPSTQRPSKQRSRTQPADCEVAHSFASG